VIRIDQVKYLCYDCYALVTTVISHCLRLLLPIVLIGLGRDFVNLSTLYSNRAACHMKVGDCQGCIIDCESALALCPRSTKPLLRRAMAYETLEKYTTISQYILYLFTEY